MRPPATRHSSSFYRDYRLGGIERLFIGEPEDYRVRVPDEIRECVCFLCVKEIEAGREHMKYGGTGFFVSVESQQPDGSHGYLVTAKHCVTRAEEKGGLILRVNNRAGGSKFIPVNGGWDSDNPASDVAVLDWAFDEVCDFRTIPLLMFAGTSAINEHGIGVGDELVLTGLFTKRRGLHRNLPIVRTGIIAAMPDEQFWDLDRTRSSQ